MAAKSAPPNPKYPVRDDVVEFPHRAQTATRVLWELDSMGGLSRLATPITGTKQGLSGVVFQVGWRWGGRGANTWLIVPARECAALWFADVSIAWRMEAPAPLYHVGGGVLWGLIGNVARFHLHTHTHLWTLSLDLNMTGAGRCVVDVWSWRCPPHEQEIRYISQRHTCELDFF